MKKLQAVFAFVAVLALTTAAEAADLWTMPLYIGAGDYLECKLINISAYTLNNVYIRIYSGGEPIQTFGPFSLPSLLEAQTVMHAAENERAFCRFTAPSKVYVRGGAAIFSGGGSDHVVIPAQ
jgi:hypothetical protein